MAEQGFRDIVTFAMSCFPGLREWLQKAGEGTADVWREALSDLDVGHAKTVLRSMVRGDEEIPPFTELPSRLRKGVQRLSFSGFDTQSAPSARPEVYICPDCQDTGWVIVVSPKQDPRPLRNPPDNWEQIPDDKFPFRVRHCCVACDKCERGERNGENRWRRLKGGKWEESRQGPPVAFQEDRMCKVDPAWTDKQKFAALRKFWANYKLPNRYREFDAWADSQEESEVA